MAIHAELLFRHRMPSEVTRTTYLARLSDDQRWSRGTSIGRLWTQSLRATSVLWMELWPALRKGRASLSSGTMGDPSHSWFPSSENDVNERCRRHAIPSEAAVSMIAGPSASLEPRRALGFLVCVTNSSVLDDDRNTGNYR